MEQFRTLKAISGWMDGAGWILLRTLVQLEHLAVLINYRILPKQVLFQVL